MKSVLERGLNFPLCFAYQASPTLKENWCTLTFRLSHPNSFYFDYQHSSNMSRATDSKTLRNSWILKGHGTKHGQILETAARNGQTLALEAEI
jgi:hypothetical protein